MDTEEWRQIPDAPGYSASSAGRVIGPSGKVLLPRLHTNGYQRVSLALGNRQYVDRYIHELVLSAFVAPRPAGCEADHRDRNRANNRLDNLRWLSQRANRDRRQIARGAAHGNAVLDELSVREIRLAFEAGQRNSQIALRLGVARRTIADIRNGKTWSHLI